MTYSIVRRDESSGELGVAVQSRAFGVGICAWARRTARPLGAREHARLAESDARRRESFERYVRLGFRPRAVLDCLD